MRLAAPIFVFAVLFHSAALAQDARPFRARAEIAAALYAATATQSATDRSLDVEITSRHRTIESLRARLAETGAHNASLREQLVVEQERYNTELAAKDRAYAMEIEILRGAIEEIAETPDGLDALGRFNHGDEIGALAVLDRLRDARQRARAVRDALQSAAEARTIATLALEARNRGRIESSAVIVRFEEVTQLDPGLARDWIELDRLYLAVGRYEDAERAAEAAEHVADNDRARVVALIDRGDIRNARGDTQGATELLRRAFDLSVALAAANPDSKHDQFTLAIGHERLGNIARGAGNPRLALSEYQNRHAIFVALSERHPDDADILREFNVSYRYMGNAQGDFGDCRAALLSYEAALDSTRRLRAQRPDAMAAILDEATTQRQRIWCFRRLGESENARSAARAAVTAWRDAMARDAGQVRILSGLSNALSDLGDLERQSLSRFDEAIAAYAEAISLARRTTGNRESQIGDLLARLGAAQQGSGDFASAQRSFEEAVQIADAHLTQNPGSPSTQVSFTLEKLGDFHRSQGAWAEALTAHSRSLEVRRRAVTRTPDLFSAQTDLAISLERVAHAMLGATPRRANEARQLLRELVALDEHLLSTDAQNFQRAWALGYAAGTLATVELELGDVEAAVNASRKAAGARGTAFQIDPSRTHLLRERCESLWQIAFLTNARADWEAAITALRDARSRGIWHDGHQDLLTRAEAALLAAPH